MSVPRIHAFGLPLALAGTAAVLAGAVLFCFDPSQCSFYPVCVFHVITGLQCPGCGTLRALHQLLHGHVLAALYYNALFVLGLPVGAVGGVYWGWCRLRRQPASFSVRPVWLWAGGAVLLIFSLVRNLPAPYSQWLGLHP